LIQKGFSANIEDLLRDLRERDARDSNRASAPLKPADDAKVLDSSALSIGEAVHRVIDWYAETLEDIRGREGRGTSQVVKS
jgi:cytidylate kinase